jgi:hypothetical protein
MRDAGMRTDTSNDAEAVPAETMVAFAEAAMSLFPCYAEIA